MLKHVIAIIVGIVVSTGGINCRVFLDVCCASPEDIPVTSGSPNLNSIPAKGKIPFMDFRSVTDETSPQWEILSRAAPDEYGLMWYEGALCVALGQSWGRVGDKIVFDIGGQDIVCVIADMKAAEHTLNGEGWYGLDGHTIECIVDMDRLHPEAMIMGDCDYIPLLNGEVEKDD